MLFNRAMLAEGRTIVKSYDHAHSGPVLYGRGGLLREANPVGVGLSRKDGQALGYSRSLHRDFLFLDIHTVSGLQIESGAKAHILVDNIPTSHSLSLARYLFHSKPGACPSPEFGLRKVKGFFVKVPCPLQFA